MFEMLRDLQFDLRLRHRLSGLTCSARCKKCGYFLTAENFEVCLLLLHTDFPRNMFNFLHWLYILYFLTQFHYNSIHCFSCILIKSFLYFHAILSKKCFTLPILFVCAMWRSLGCIRIHHRGHATPPLCVSLAWLARSMQIATILIQKAFWEIASN